MDREFLIVSGTGRSYLDLRLDPNHELLDRVVSPGGARTPQSCKIVSGEAKYDATIN